jgi:LPS-assembly lipoprotein
MSWSDPQTPRVSRSGRPGPRGRRALLVGLVSFAAASLAGCGFTPVYAPGSTGAALDGTVEVVQSGGSLGFTLTEALQDRLGAPGSNARYRLTTVLGVTSERVAITTAQSTNRFNLIGTVAYTLTDAATGQPAATGRVDGFNSYSAIGTALATGAAEEDAYERLMVILADKIVADLLVAPELAR